jgi:dCTP deaminase
VASTIWNAGDLWDHIEANYYRLEPGGFVLAQTLEKVTIPNDLVGFVEGRSSYARVGVTIHVTAPKIDPGFCGHITLEMANFGQAPVELCAEEARPAQLMLFRISTPLGENHVYGSGPNDGFQHQNRPIPSGEPR